MFLKHSSQMLLRLWSVLFVVQPRACRFHVCFARFIKRRQILKRPCKDDNGCTVLPNSKEYVGRSFKQALLSGTML